MSDSSLSFLLDSLITDLKARADETCMVDSGGKRRISGCQFLRMMNTYVHLLRTKGIQQGDAVAIRLDRGAEHIAAFFACMSMGCPYVTISIDYPDARVDKIMGSCSPKAIIDEGFVSQASESDDVPEYAPIDISDDAPYAYFYTSGSTGEPKGILHNRRALTNSVKNMDHIFDLSTIGPFVSVSNYIFIVSLTEISMFIHGKEMHVLDRSFILDVEPFRRYLFEHNITYAFLNPSFLRSLGPNSPLKCISIGGEKPGKFVGFTGKRIVNDYGSTETSMMAWGVVEDGVEPALHSTPHGTRLYLSEGDKGEILLERVPTMMCYVGVEGFEDKFESVPESDLKICHTGDLGMMTDRGIVIVGRMDSMVKVNGQRVEPADVEYAIENIPGIEEAVVKAFEEDGKTYLYSYYTSPPHVSEDEVRKALSMSLQSYMVPSFITRLESFPRNDRNKVDRGALPKPDLSLLRAEYMPPRNYNEKVLCKAFSDVLGMDTIGIDDDFVRLGGDSLKAMQVNTLCGDKGVSVTTADIISNKTVRAIAEILTEEPTESFHGEIPPTPMQIDIIENDPVAETLLFRTRGQLCPDTLQRALDSITDRHDMLRATFDGGMIIRPSGKRTCDLRLGTVPSPEDIPTLEARSSLSDNVPFRCCLYSMDGDDRQFLTISLHPAIADPESYAILIDELAIAYESVQGEGSMPRGTMSFKQWSDIHEGYVPSEKASEHWKAMEDGIDDTDGHDDTDWIPLDRCSDISLTELSDNEYLFDLDTILLSAMTSAYCSVTGKGSMMVSMRGSGRSIADVQRTIGQFGNRYPLRLSHVEGSVQSLFNVRRSIYGVPRKGTGYMKSGCNTLPDNRFETNTYPSLDRGPFEFMKVLDAGPLSEIHIRGIVDIRIHETDGGYRITGRCDPSVGEGFVHRFMSSIDDAYTSLKASDVYEFPFFEIMEFMYHEYKKRTQSDPDIMPMFFSNTLKFDLPQGFGIDDVRSVLRKMMDAHPILGSRLVIRNGEHWCITDRTLEQIIRVPEDAPKPPDADEGFVAFDVHMCDTPYFEIKLLHTIYDHSSIEILENEVRSAIEGKDPIREVGFLQKMFHEDKIHSFDTNEEMHLRYGQSLSKIPSIRADDASYPGVMIDGIVGMNKQEVDAFLMKHSVTTHTFFAAVLSHSASIITKESDISISTMYNGRHVVPDNTIFMCANELFVDVECGDLSVSDYLSGVVESVSDAMGFFGIYYVEMLEFTPQSFHTSLNCLRRHMTQEHFETRILKNDYRILTPIILRVEEYDNCYKYSSCGFRMDSRRAVAFIRLFETVANGMMRAERMSEIVIPEDIMRDLPRIA